MGDLIKITEDVVIVLRNMVLSTKCSLLRCASLAGEDEDTFSSAIWLQEYDQTHLLCSVLLR